MAMGGGGVGSKWVHGGQNNKRGRQYGMMLLLAFGAALFGVMILHKFKERRVFNLLIQDKDRHILSLHLHLQKERDVTKELKRKVEELKAKAYSLRTQKMELHNKLLEMQSISSSLKEGHKELASALNQRENEIKRLREKDIYFNHEKSRITTLTEYLKQKEVEIEDLKRQLQKPANILSVSTDDPSVLTMTGGVSSNVENRTSGSEGQNANSSDMQSIESTDQKLDSSRTGEGVGKKSAVGEKKSENNQGNEHVRGDEKLKKFENSQDSKGSGVSVEMDDSNTTETSVSSGTGEALKTDQGGDAVRMGGDAHEISKHMQPEKLEESQAGEGRKLGVITKDQMNLKVDERSGNAVGYRMRGDNSHRNVTKGKKRRIIIQDIKVDSKKGQSNKGGSTLAEEEPTRKRGRVTVRDRIFVENERPQDHKIGLLMGDEGGDQDASAMGKLSEGSKYEEGLKEEDKGRHEILRDSEGTQARSERSVEKELEGSKEGGTPRKTTYPQDMEDMKTEVTSDYLNQQGGKDVEIVSTDGQSENSQNSQDEEDIKSEVTRADSNQQGGKEYEIVSEEGKLESLQDSQDGEGTTASTINGDSTGQEHKQKSDGVNIHADDQQTMLTSGESENDPREDEELDNLGIGEEKEKNLE